MAINQDNFKKRAKFIVEVYQEAKERDIPDTRILRVVFPTKGIYISYRQWMRIKAMKPSEYESKQLAFGFES